VRAGRTVIGVVLLAVVVGLAYRLVTNGGQLVGSPDGCTATAAGRSAHLDIGQAENAVIIAAVADARGLPPRAVSIAYATTLQESKLRNLDHGDRDSLGLFQQRSSQGWGTPAQIMDPYYAAGKFFDALVQIPDYVSKDLGQVAQAIQRSGYPDAYDAHVADGRTLASGITGQTPAGFRCVVHAGSVRTEHASGTALIPRAQRVRSALRRPYQAVTTVAGHGTRLRVGVSAPAGSPRTWAVANFLMADAKRLGIASIRCANRIWRTGDPSTHGWVRTGRTPPNEVVVTVLN
jgi:hypothetical protein